ncbi:SHOCT domain-containing protein [Paractinoplanes atraurantiacus]|uniref:Short C-terminal domain-containing protein n=1 Tax=Paractinoplanes atraurantiacus TaxID=1036182 RepID=A0A285IYI2_9ACTN|nr:SHOCT domain-containing protein [Actinoplanes atraurantiacus]SNY53109.1 Short C-terminal domain-containing protein [Actinoplanes atraurantiacus]
MPGLLRGIARTAVVAGTASAVSGRVRHRQDGRWARQEAENDMLQQQQQQQYAPPPQQVYVAAPPAAAAPASPDMAAKIDQLKQLADLKAQGILTDAEFEAQKARILGQ